MEEEKRDYFITPNIDLKGEAAFDVWEDGLREIGYVAGCDYRINAAFATINRISINANSKLLDKLIGLGLISEFYEPDNTLVALKTDPEPISLDDVISQGPA